MEELSSRPPVKPYPCYYDGCREAYTRIHRLRSHVAYKHMESMPHQCQYCLKRFIEKVALSAHLKTHTGDRLFACRFCSKRFNTRGNQQDHERRHNKIRPYGCDKCDQSYYRRYLLTQHITQKHDIPDQQMTQIILINNQQPIQESYLQNTSVPQPIQNIKYTHQKQYEGTMKTDDQINEDQNCYLQKSIRQSQKQINQDEEFSQHSQRQIIADFQSQEKATFISVSNDEEWQTSRCGLMMIHPEFNRKERTEEQLEITYRQDYSDQTDDNDSGQLTFDFYFKQLQEINYD